MCDFAVRILAKFNIKFVTLYTFFAGPYANTLLVLLFRYVGFWVPNQVGSETITAFFFRYLFQRIST
jgi:hypothetical protein